LDRLELEYIKTRDADLFEQMSALWNADTHIDKEKVNKIFSIMENLAGEIV